MSWEDYNLQMARNHIADLLDEAQTLFKEPMALTFIARHPTNPDRHMMVTSDSPEGIRKALGELPSEEDDVDALGRKR